MIRWHIQRGVVVLPKSTHADRIRQNIDVFDFVLSDDDMAAISAMDTGKRNSATRTISISDGSLSVWRIALIESDTPHATGDDMITGSYLPF